MKKQMIFRAAAIVFVLAVAVVMFIIGRGHTVYFDNKTMDYEGKTYEAFYRAEVLVKGERVAKLQPKDRGMAETMGQPFSMVVKVTKEKDGKAMQSTVNMSLPYGMDGVVINLPALLNGLPEEAYLSEFVPVATTEDDDEEVIITEELEMPIEE